MPPKRSRRLNTAPRRSRRIQRLSPGPSNAPSLSNEASPAIITVPSVQPDDRRRLRDLAPSPIPIPISVRIIEPDDPPTDEISLNTTPTTDPVIDASANPPPGAPASPAQPSFAIRVPPRPVQRHWRSRSDRDYLMKALASYHILATAEMSVPVRHNGQHVEFSTRLQVTLDPEGMGRLRYRAKFMLNRTRPDGVRISKRKVGEIVGYRFSKPCVGKHRAEAEAFEWFVDVPVNDRLRRESRSLYESARVVQMLYLSADTVMPLTQMLWTKKLVDRELMILESVRLGQMWRTQRELVKYAFDGFHELLRRLPEWFHFDGIIMHRAPIQWPREAIFDQSSWMLFLNGYEFWRANPRVHGQSFELMSRVCSDDVVPDPRRPL